MSAPVPPGWPRAVPPPAVDGWQRQAAGWLLDLCPPDYRGYPVLQRHPVALARLAAQHVDADLEAVRRGTATARSALTAAIGTGPVEEVLEVLAVEEARLLGARRAVALVEEALHGRRYVPRL